MSKIKKIDNIVSFFEIGDEVRSIHYVDSGVGIVVKEVPTGDYLVNFGGNVSLHGKWSLRKIINK